MLNNYTDEVNLLLKWYERTKRVVIEAESFDTLNKAYIQPLHEQRYCLEHFVRAITYEQESENNEETIKKSITSAIGHLQRAYSDSIEWMLMSVKEEYITILKPFSNEQINTVLPEYYTEIRPTFEKITDTVNRYKETKSIERATDIEIVSDGELKTLCIIAEQFLSDDVVKILKDYLNLLHNREQALIEAKKRDRWITIRDKIIIPIITAIIGGLIVAFIGHKL